MTSTPRVLMTACKMHGLTEGQQPSHFGVSNLQIELHTSDQPSDSFQPHQPVAARSAWLR